MISRAIEGDPELVLVASKFDDDLALEMGTIWICFAIFSHLLPYLFLGEIPPVPSEDNTPLPILELFEALFEEMKSHQEAEIESLRREVSKGASETPVSLNDVYMVSIREAMLQISMPVFLSADWAQARLVRSSLGNPPFSQFLNLPLFCLSLLPVDSLVPQCGRRT